METPPDALDPFAAVQAPLRQRLELPPSMPCHRRRSRQALRFPPKEGAGPVRAAPIPSHAPDRAASVSPSRDFSCNRVRPLSAFSGMRTLCGHRAQSSDTRLRIASPSFPRQHPIIEYEPIIYCVKYAYCRFGEGSRASSPCLCLTKPSIRIGRVLRPKRYETH